jgi:hypothetical protein
MAARAGDPLNGAEAIAAALSIVDRVAGPGALRVTGWATVELDRAEQDLAAAFVASGPPTSRDLPDDALLGARCRLVTFRVGEREVLLLEPSTEGRIAASLARFGEGPIAIYVLAPKEQFGDMVRDARRAGLVLSAEAAGPFGRQRLVAGGPPWGAHLAVAESAGNRQK